MKITPELPNLEITPDLAQEIEEFDFDEFKKKEAYQKYCVPFLNRQKEIKKQKVKNWWKYNWIGIVTLIITAISLISTILFGLLQLLK